VKLTAVTLSIKPGGSVREIEVAGGVKTDVREGLSDRAGRRDRIVSNHGPLRWGKQALRLVWGSDRIRTVFHSARRYQASGIST